MVGVRGRHAQPRRAARPSSATVTTASWTASRRMTRWRPCDASCRSGSPAVTCPSRSPPGWATWPTRPLRAGNACRCPSGPGRTAGSPLPSPRTCSSSSTTWPRPRRWRRSTGTGAGAGWPTRRPPGAARAPTRPAAADPRDAGASAPPAADARYEAGVASLVRGHPRRRDAPGRSLAALQCPAASARWTVYRALRRINPSPHLFAVDLGPGRSMLGASPSCSSG